jgi:GAF domain-containing protein
VAERTLEIERRRKVAEGLADLLTVVNSGHALDEILEYVVAQARRLLGSDAEALYLLDEREPSMLRLQASRGVPPEASTPIMPNGFPIMGLAAERRRAVLVTDFPEMISQPFAPSIDEQIEDRGAYLEVVRPGPASVGQPVQQRRNLALAKNFHTVLSVPLLAGDTSYGALTLAYRAVHVPSAEELELTGAFASQAGLAIENARLHDREEQRTRDMDRRRQVAEGLRDLLVTVNSTHTLAELLREVAVQAGRLLGSDASEISLADGVGDDVLPTTPTDPQAAGYLAVLAVPLAVKDEVYGTLTLHYNDARDFGDEERALATAFADQAALAIENARLHSESQRRLRGIEALYRADESLHRSLRLDDVLQALVDQAATILQAEKTSVLIWDAARMRLTVRAAHGFEPRQLERMSFARGEGISARVAVSGEVIAVQDVYTDPRIPAHINQAINQDAGIRSIISVPIKLKGEVFGVFNVNSTRPRSFGNEEQRLLAALADRAALAIENARVHAQAEQSLQELEALYRADEVMHRSLRVDEVLQALLEVAASILGAPWIAIFLWDEHQQRMVAGAVRGTSSNMLAESFAVDEARIVRESLEGPTVTAVEDLFTDPRMSERIRAISRREGLGATLSGIIRSGGQLLGSFTLGYPHRRTFTQEERRLLGALAQRAALAIQNARLHEESGRRLSELEALYRADEQIYASLRVQEVLDALVDVASEILKPDKVSVGIWDEATNQITVGAARGFGAETVAAAVAPNEMALLLANLENGVCVMEDATTDPRLPPSVRLANEREGVCSTMTAPIKAGEVMIGAFGISYCGQRRFSAEAQRLLQALAQRAGLAIQNARLYEQAQQAATLEERQRLARDLHDAVTQTLFSTALIAEVIPELWDIDPAQGRHRLEELRRLTRGALAEMRTLLVELRPGALTELPLGDLLRQLVEATAGRTRLELAESVRGVVRPVPAAAQVALYRIAQEALNNVVKHAQARRAAVTLEYEANGGVRLRLEDDGRGFDSSVIPSGHLGVSIMRERAEAIAATFQLTSAPNDGTSIEVYWHEMEETSP